MSETFTAEQVEATRVTLTGLSRSTTMDAWTVAAIGKAVPMLRALAARLREEAENEARYARMAGLRGRAVPLSSFPPSTAQEIADMARTPGPIIAVPGLNDPDNWTGEYRTQRAVPGVQEPDETPYVESLEPDIYDTLTEKKVSDLLRFTHGAADLRDGLLSVIVPWLQERDRKVGAMWQRWSPEPLPGLAELLTHNGMEIVRLAANTSVNSAMSPMLASEVWMETWKAGIVAMLSKWLASRDSASTARIAELEQHNEALTDGMRKQAASGETMRAQIEYWKEAFDGMTVAKVQAEAALTGLAGKAKALAIDANRLCDRQQGGTYEDDCRKSIAYVYAALAALPKESR